jgi:hypothetical protein
MTRLRAFALVTVSTALLVGSAAPTLAANAPAPRAATTTSSTCHVPAADEVLTAQESLRLVQQCRTASQAKAWHWMGNYGSVTDVESVANQLGVGPGGLITEANSTGVGLLPTFMYY